MPTEVPRPPQRELVTDFRRRLDQVERAVELAVTWQYHLRNHVDGVRDETKEDRLAPVRAKLTALERTVEQLRGQVQDITQLLVSRHLLMEAAGPASPPPPGPRPGEATPSAPAAPPGRGAAMPSLPPPRAAGVRALTAARWSARAIAPGDSVDLYALADGFPESAEAAVSIRVLGEDAPLAELRARVKNGAVQARWEAPDTGGEELHLDFTVRLGHHRTTSDRLRVRVRGEGDPVGDRPPAPVPTLSLARWSTSAARVGEPIQLQVIAAGFADDTLSSIEILVEDETEPLARLSDTVRAGVVDATWVVTDAARGRALTFVVRVGDQSVRSEPLAVGSEVGRRREVGGRRTDDRAPSPPLAPVESSPETDPRLAAAPQFRPEPQPAATPPEPRPERPLEGEPRAMVTPAVRAELPEETASTTSYTRDAILGALAKLPTASGAAPAPPPVDPPPASAAPPALPDDTGETTEYSREAILAAITKLPSRGALVPEGAADDLDGDTPPDGDDEEGERTRIAPAPSGPKKK